MIILTSGKTYIDIDGYAGCIAYRELLKLQGNEVQFVNQAKPNYSITRSLINLPIGADKYNINKDDKFIIIDLSNKKYFPSFVQETGIIEVIDHHPGFEDYWKNKLGNKAIIEEIGSVATIIVEKYEQESLLNSMDTNVAKLLMSAILDNTLNFTANIVSKRDKEAYKKLEAITEEYDYAEKYFKETQNSISKNMEEAIKNDVKTTKMNQLLPEVFAQLTVWEANKFIKNNEKLKSTMNSYGNSWIINIISLKENISYVFYSDKAVKEKLCYFLNCNFDNEKIIIKPAMLRKEILKRAILKSGNTIK